MYILHLELEVIVIIKNSVKQSRIQKQMTQEEVAEKVGVTRQTIGLIEKEKYNPTISLALNLCKVLNKSLDQLFWIEEEENEK
jgi:putative transcriptional regulator